MTNFPVPFTFEYKDLGSSYDRTSNQLVTPYSDLDWIYTALKYGVNVPEVVDRTCGKSVCKSCGAKYVGNQAYCTVMTTFSIKKNNYWAEKERGYRSGREYAVKEEPCGGHLEWDQQEKFDFQYGLFSLLDMIKSLPDISYDPLFKYQTLFPEGVVTALRVRLLRQDMERNDMMIQDALRQIASKMTNAGACLSFGF
jgi:hypothetical protein